MWVCLFICLFVCRCVKSRLHQTTPPCTFTVWLVTIVQLLPDYSFLLECVFDGIWFRLWHVMTLSHQYFRAIYSLVFDEELFGFCIIYVCMYWRLWFRFMLMYFGSQPLISWLLNLLMWIFRAVSILCVSVHLLHYYHYAMAFNKHIVFIRAERAHQPYVLVYINPMLIKCWHAKTNATYVPWFNFEFNIQHSSYYGFDGRHLVYGWRVYVYAGMNFFIKM